ncbi:hypothetical protein HPB51_017873 [Rhipicephalus microplus]|uniref:Peptidase A1 domain-containing protein n=1 Tax=Rhipicephalus microplus TaxID=6941 RepID=A0A9J6E2D6_RHIMP|nr:hypothetical protein HPB51_017873 [Rhipicephalus microplus]
MTQEQPSNASRPTPMGSVPYYRVPPNLVGTSGEDVDVWLKNYKRVRRISPKFGRLSNVPTAASVETVPPNDLALTIRQIVREELLRCQQTYHRPSDFQDVYQTLMHIKAHGRQDSPVNHLPTTNEVLARLFTQHRLSTVPPKGGTTIPCLPRGVITLNSHVPIDRFRGNVTGYVFRDAHELGGVSLGNLQFVNGIGFHGVPSFVDKPFDGVFGLRLGANSTLYEMAKSGVIGSPRVGLYFSNDMTSPGEALFGGANEQHYQGSMTFVEALDSAFQVHLKGYEVAGQREGLRASWARPAPTEPFIGGPASEVKKINRLIGARKIEDGKYQLQYELRCNARTSDFTFIFGGQEIVLRPEDYVVKVETTTETTCYSGFVETEKVANASWHLGLVFLRRVYTVLEAPLEPYGNGRKISAMVKNGCHLSSFHINTINASRSKPKNNKVAMGYTSKDEYERKNLWKNTRGLNKGVYKRVK